MRTQESQPLRSYGSVLGLAAAVVLLTAPALAAQTARIAAEADPCLNVRERPSYRSVILECVDAGSEVSISDRQSGWSRIATANGTEGWAGTRFLIMDSEESQETGIRIERSSSPPPTPSGGDPVDARLASALARVEELERQLAEYARLSLDAEALGRLTAERDDALERLGRVEEETATLEAEIAALRQTQESSADEAGALSERVQELIAERDLLRRQLANAEARQLYLQSDLEETRAELMQLKGVPSQVVREEPQPVLVRPDVGLDPESGDATATDEPAIPDIFAPDEVVRTVEAWALSWSEQRAEDYLSFYAGTFSTPNGISRRAWEQLRRERISTPASIEVAVEQISPIVTGDRAVVTFVQRYTSDTFGDVVDKTLVLERVEGSWRIVEELVADS